MPRNRNVDQSTATSAQASRPSEEISGEQNDAQIQANFYIYTERIIALETRASETDKKIEQSRDKNIETLGLFVALFTFISIEFTLFREITNFSAAVSISLIAAGLLIFFVLILHLIIISSGNNTSKWIKAFYVGMFLAAVGLIIGGIGFNNFFSNDIDYQIKSPTPTINPTITPPNTPTITPPENDSAN